MKQTIYVNEDVEIAVWMVTMTIKQGVTYEVVRDKSKTINLMGHDNTVVMIGASKFDQLVENGTILEVEESANTITTDRHTFEIVEEVPAGYIIWNIPSKGLEEYLPLMKSKTSTMHKVDTTTLKAIKVTKGIDEIKNAASWGMRNTDQARKVINDTHERQDRLKSACAALPYMTQVKGL